jgi:hypothetical protein
MSDNASMTSNEKPDEARQGTAAEPAPQGLFEGFAGYRTPSTDDYRRVLTEGLVVPDTNVLLNLYRYNAQTQAMAGSYADSSDVVAVALLASGGWQV